MYQVYLGIGSNLGDRLEFLSHAVEEIAAISTIESISSIYETEPVGIENCDSFLNMVLSIRTQDDPPLLLARLKKIERKLGRRQRSHMETRTIDIDILMYRGLAYQDNTVRVPHVELETRRFVLEPLCEIAPTAVHPMLEKTIASLLRNCRDQHKVIRTEYQLNQSVLH
ncbi:MAG: 2-amino-4-hydroxy-6-hydroxymethyldihydropteridine diphosphokinase [Ignavibacteriales bacterium]|nr:2-amino-4-hydroxy-6-hydroxymethyldihydropteridine diphosphokinase [Ignavibacteriales bacterium]